MQRWKVSTDSWSAQNRTVSKSWNKEKLSLMDPESSDSPTPAAPDSAAPPEVLDLALDTPDGMLRARLAIPPGTLRLSELALSAMALSERIVGLAVRREAQADNAVSCRKGCGVCCRQLVPVSPPEAWIIADVLGAWPAPRRAAVLERFEAITRVLHEGGYRERLLQAKLTDEEVRDLGRDYFNLGQSCPFLDDQGACSIYPCRPSICREYLVTSPPECCADPFGQPVRRITVSVRLSQALAQLTAELLGGEPRVMPLVLVPAWAAEHAAEARRQWPARPLLERLLELMSKK